jgi:hypothetical protein
MLHPKIRGPAPAPDRAIPASVADVRIREFNLKTEDPLPLVGMKEVVFGIPVDISLWEWQYLRNPPANQPRIYIAEAGNELVAATSRFPFRMQFGGRTIESFFSFDSMVHPNWRRLGLMERLYGKTFEEMPILFSKGTTSNMYGLLRKQGYRDIVPNSILVRYLSPVRLLFRKAGFIEELRTVPVGKELPKGFAPIQVFGEDFDRFRERISKRFNGIVVKNSRFMNWRYGEIPNRNYTCCYRKNMAGEIAAVLVFRINGSSCSVVDISWDPADSGEPGKTIRSLCVFLKEKRIAKVSCWGTYGRLREALRGNGFMDRGETPRFSFRDYGSILGTLIDGRKFHFVDGDGDSEYCTS